MYSFFDGAKVQHRNDIKSHYHFFFWQSLWNKKNKIFKSCLYTNKKKIIDIKYANKSIWYKIYHKKHCEWLIVNNYVVQNEMYVIDDKTPSLKSISLFGFNSFSTLWKVWKSLYF